MHRRDEGEHIRVLVVDDERSIRLALRDMLLDFAYDVQTASDGREAVAAYHDFEPDIVLLDMNMPRMGGLDVIRHLREAEGDADVLITMLTSDRSPRNKLEAFGAGANDFLYKPFDRAELLARVAVAARQVRLTSRLRRAYEAMDDELAEVAELQDKLLPAAEPGPVSWPGMPGIMVRSLYNPSGRASGDYYDYFPLGGGMLRVVVADVSGHGARAAFLMGMVRSLFHVSVAQGMDLAETVQLVNRQLCDIIREEEDFVTLFTADIDVAGRRLEYVSAGHCPGLLHDGDAVRHLPPTATVLGFFEMDFPASRVDLPRDWSLFLFTDGFYDWRLGGERLFGFDEFAALAGELLVRERSGGFPESLMEALATIGDGPPAFRDDLTALWIRHRGADGRTWCTPARAAEGRAAVKEIMREVDKHVVDPDVRYELDLALTEAVANAVEHAYPDGGGEVEIELCVEPGRRIGFRVADRGPGFAPGLLRPEAPPPPEAEHGRGLFILARIMDGVDVSRDDAGRNVVACHKRIGREAWKS